ncbi:hypothetical protein ASJ81_14795 [Methanosarcina spelaei]|uniref:Uncharacterized protein n=1 Tax=Methanosarcina spelaei TaxID=1036679 RepID=A0A2A2HY30_9EURY|nr:hypothetical protein ASJ81_14795 [Methanosarcina spelaei]
MQKSLDFGTESENLFSHDSLLFYMSCFVVLSVAGFFSGIKYSQKKPTRNIWLIAYILLYVNPTFWEILRNENSKELVIIAFFFIFAVIYAELSDYVWKIWMKYVSLRFTGAATS